MFAALKKMKDQNNPWWEELSSREKEIVCYLDIVHPLPESYEIGQEQCCDVPGPQTAPHTHTRSQDGLPF